jgi:hypothetical protein
MKKTYKLDHPKIKVPRLVDSIKHEIKKTLKKERAQKLPDGAKYLKFDCKLGQSEETASAVPLLELMKSIDELVENKAKTIYVEMTAKAVATLDEAKIT